MLLTNIGTGDIIIELVAKTAKKQIESRRNQKTF